MTAIKISKREALRATLDEAQRRLWRRSREAQERSEQARKKWFNANGDIVRLLEGCVLQRHDKEIKKLRKALASFPGVSVNVQLLTAKKPSGDVDVNGTHRYSVAVSGLVFEGSVMPPPPLKKMTELVDAAAAASDEYKRYEREAHELSEKARRYDVRELMSDVIMKLPDEAAPHLDALIAMIEKTQVAD